MAEKNLQFEIYRLNLVDEDTFAFEFMGREMRNDGDIRLVLERVTEPRFDLNVESGRATYRWAAREYLEFRYFDEDPSSMMCLLSLARSTLSQRGQTITERTVEDALTTLSPPPAEVIHLLFYMKRHLVIVEYSSSLMQTNLWRDSLHSMLHRAAHSAEFRTDIRLEPVPRDEEIISAFRSFQRLVRLRVKLRIPNPEMDRRTEQLRQEMMRSSIREYTQDMKNPSGLSQDEGGLPHATVAMAQAGYKDGEVVMVGIRDGRRRTVRTGKRAARGRVEGLRDFVRGLGANVRTVEGRRIVRTILDEVDRIAEVPAPPTSEQEQ
jgi:hypothetical protein